MYNRPSRAGRDLRKSYVLGRQTYTSFSLEICGLHPLTSRKALASGKVRGASSHLAPGLVAAPA
ncbi:hypothetical protein DSO57_1036637 [Entomophthora muscae]|uniref:Uncharacterized protein n=1 Tax=Entomophthora muscae TaxID=34485 RepID=A0ACC2RDZ8_9FUNG|nr:hypothetical protein DSO57_1036637 [Entomophthora muscae]